MTSFEYRLHPLETMLAGMVIYPIAHANAFLTRYREVTSTAPDELGSLVALGTLPARGVRRSVPFDVGL